MIWRVAWCELANDMVGDLVGDLASGLVSELAGGWRYDERFSE